MSTLNVDKVDPSTGTALEIGSSGDTITIPSGATIVNSGTATGFGAALTGSTNNTIVTVTGANAIQGESTLTYDGTNLDMGDSKKIRLGDGNDLEIYHNGSHSFIADNGGGSLIIDTNNGSEVDINSGGNAEFMGRFIKDGAVKLYHNGSEKLETTSTGADVTGGLGVGTAKDLGVGIHVRTSDTGGDVHSGADQLVLEANTDMGMTMLASTSGECFINFGDSGDNDIGQMSYHHSSNHMAFKTNASEAMRIHSSGKISMGSTSTAGGFHVMYDAGNSTSQGSIAVSSDNTGAATGIIFFDGDNHNCGRISVLGSSNEIAIYGESSDYRLKKDIADMDSSWELIKSLKPRKFKWKDNEELGYHNSFIAHELQEIIPKAVSGEKDAMTPEVLYTADDELPEGKNIGDVKEETKIDPQFIATAGLTTYLTNALKEAITKIETLEAKVAVLEG